MEQKYFASLVIIITSLAIVIACIIHDETKKLSAQIEKQCPTQVGKE